MFRLPSTVRRSWRICVVAAVAAAGLAATGLGTAAASEGPSSAAALRTVHSRLAEVLVPHTSVGIDPATNQVVLTIGDAAAGTAGLVSAASQFRSAVRIERIPGGFETLVLQPGVVTLGWFESFAVVSGSSLGLASTPPAGPVQHVPDC